jgi:dTMP kinase
MEQKRGKLIVIDGPDATGKATQTRILRERLEREGFPARSISFPRYENLSSAAVWLYLERHEGSPFLFADKESAMVDIMNSFESGKDKFLERLWQIIAQGTSSPWGDGGKSDPYAPSLFYAIDRAAAKKEILEGLERGINYVSDRYTSANLIHQGSKIADQKEFEKYITRVRELEYEWLGIPKPDANLILRLDPAISEKFQEKKLSQLKVFREADAHEKDMSHQQAAFRTCKRLAELCPQDFSVVECTRGGRVLSEVEVHEKIWTLIMPLFEK